MNKEFIEAIDQLEKEKGISTEQLFEAIESALISAYKKNYGVEGNVEVKIDREQGEIDVLTKMEVVEEENLENETEQMTLQEAQDIDPDYEVGDYVEFQVTPKDFGRIAAQTAKQVVVQRIREAERGLIFDDYVGRIGEVITGTIHRKSNETLFINMGKTEGILSPKEQVPGERFRVNDRIKVYVMDVKKSNRGPQVFLSRSHPGLVKRLFEMEVPEIEDGTVIIKNIAREAGMRTKITVAAQDENVDPVGSCVGARGNRVERIVDELSDEKIDIIPWDEDPITLINSVLAPAKVEEVFLEEEERKALVIVPDYQLSLAIGKAGQNVRLAAKVSGWKIDIKSHTQYYGEEETEVLSEDMEAESLPLESEVAPNPEEIHEEQESALDDETVSRSQEAVEESTQEYEE